MLNANKAGFGRSNTG